MAIFANGLQSLNAPQYLAVTATTAGTAVAVGQGIFYGVGVVSAGTTFNFTIYDNATTASGTQLFAGNLAGSNVLMSAYPPDVGVWFKNGLWLVVTGTPGQGMVLFQTIN